MSLTFEYCSATKQHHPKGVVRIRITIVVVKTKRTRIRTVVVVPPRMNQGLLEETKLAFYDLIPDFPP